MTKLPSQATIRIREALEELLRRSELNHGREVTDMFLGPDIFVALLRRPQVVEGEWQDTERTMDLLDLMDAYGPGGKGSGPTDPTRRRPPAEHPAPE
jgi:hypothetical protein